MNQQGAHRYEDRLLEFAYGELPVAEARSIEAHVKGCARCTGALREIEGVRHQMSQLAPEPAPDSGLESLLAYAQQAARRAQTGPAPSRGIRRWLFGAVGAASLAAVLVVVGVVANDPKLAPVSADAIKKDEARSLAQESAPAASAAPAPVAQAGQGVTAEQPPETESPSAAPDLEEAQAEPRGQEQDKPAAWRQKMAGNAYEAERKPATPASKAKVGKDVGKGTGSDWVQRVDQVDVPKKNRKASRAKELNEDDAPSTRDAPAYRPRSVDQPDQMSNLIPGKAGTPPVPTTGAQGFAQKGASQPADGEMMLGGGGLDTKGSTQPRPSAMKTAQRPPARAAPVDGSGAGIGSSAQNIGRGTGKVAKIEAPSGDDDGFNSMFGGAEGGVAGGAKAPAAPPADRAGIAQLDAKQQQQRGDLAAAETSRRRVAAEELKKAESQKLLEREVASRTRMEEQAPVAQYQKKAMDPAARETRSTTTAPPPPPPAQAAATPPALSPSGAGSAAAGPAAANPQVAPAEAPAPEPAPPAQRLAQSPQPESKSKSKVYTQDAQELFTAATRARPGSAEEINGLLGALSAGLSGKYRIDALRRLCNGLGSRGDDRAWTYCSAWASADPSAAQANKYYREAQASRKSKARPAATLDAEDARPAKASEPVPSSPARE
ncbi:MAG TPA: zf-HC2 domain-containing protein [Myxococcales bacterium]|nr:zf-HC2 domain-containing protein [Myxococcales bacterium]